MEIFTLLTRHVLLDSFEPAKSISMGPASKTSSRAGKSSNGVAKAANRALPSVCFPYVDM